MKVRVPLCIITAVMMILAVMALPVSAAEVSPQCVDPTGPTDVTTTANIATGAGNIPVVLCKWEADTTGSWEDGDPTHAIPGSQFLPRRYWVRRIKFMLSSGTMRITAT